ncbi:uncharacterized protein LOC131508557 [Neofelis nebulosa]|uniref:uncharacterized protein LOC131508557 n=1 Tax=Neofelis nebulosa TaxID=61452 RepID=UPI00272A58C9|nr:uncharacterized protein LOC131508557 [Neofelis nebulosa]
MKISFTGWDNSAPAEMTSSPQTDLDITGQRNLRNGTGHGGWHQMDLHNCLDNGKMNHNLLVLTCFESRPPSSPGLCSSPTSADESPDTCRSNEPTMKEAGPGAKRPERSLHFKSQPTEVRKYSRQMSVSDGLCYSCLLSQPPNKHKIRVHFFHLIPVQFSPHKCSLPHPPSYLSESGIRPPDSRDNSQCHTSSNNVNQLHTRRTYRAGGCSLTSQAPQHRTQELEPVNVSEFEFLMKLTVKKKITEVTGIFPPPRSGPRVEWQQHHFTCVGESPSSDPSSSNHDWAATCPH